VLPDRVRERTSGISDSFVTFFLAGIGLKFNPAAFANQSIVTLALVLLFGAVASKVIGCGFGSLRYGMQVARRVGLGMIPRGEFCIVAAQIGLRLNIIAADMYAVVVFIAVATTMLAPPLIHAVFPVEEASEPVTTLP
jgi:Na+:H+ antiporter